MIGNNKQEKQ